MGGGDLNSKKSWHPNTIKNQERVWKAEQASAEEKKRILELQRERAEERDRAELNDLAKRAAGASGANDNRLHWMYDKPDKKVQQEDFLLGKAIDSNYEADKVEPDYIPAVARRVVGSSMLASVGDAQVDLARKMREDPLMLVKERERAARAALLNNPLQRRRLTELLRKDQEQRNQKKEKKKPKKDLDNMLAAKLTAMGEKQIDLVALLASNDSSSDSSSEEEHKKSKKKHKKSKKHKKEKKKSKRENSSEVSSYEDDTKKSKHKPSIERSRSPLIDSRNQKSRHRGGSPNDSDYEHSNKKYSRAEKTEARSDKEGHGRMRRDSAERGRSPDRWRRRPSEERRHGQDRRQKSPDRRRRPRSEERTHRPQERGPNKADARGGYKKKVGMSSEQRSAALAAMTAAGLERERERERRVAGQRAAAAVAERDKPRPCKLRTEAHSLPDSLESRIHSNRHYIQRDRSHMDKPFARR
ncbi:pre-mRNA-splicing factor CWC25 homolog [Cydia strobilella]|uniref:pre-mRNA-splicing factor CWC25 homolog n=1 Tax=Cydia strobilella TaxID=1100964 RepID=UPI0030049DE8